MKCSICGKEIVSEAEEYGNHKNPICQSCFLELSEEDNYGLYLELCGDVYLDGTFADELKCYIDGAKEYKIMNQELTEFLMEMK